MKERIARIFVCLLGVGFITWTVYYKWSGLSGNLNFFGPGSLAGISLGVVLISIALFTRVFCFYVAVWSIVGGVTLLAADNVLYWSSPYLPSTLIKVMTADAQSKFLFSNPQNIISANDGKVHFGKPGAVREFKGFRWIVDELGYQNPPGYLKASSGADVLVLGDSFIEYGSTPQNLRKSLSPATVYAAAIKDSGPLLWRKHFKRYVASPFVLQSPKLVILNFYSGNDITDTIRHNESPGLRPAELSAANPQWPSRRLSFFGEVFRITQMTVFPVVGDFLGMELLTGDFATEPSLELPEWPWQWHQFLESLLDTVNEIRNNDQSTKILLAYQSTAVAVYGIDPERCKEYMPQHFHRIGNYFEECEVAAANQINLSRLLGEWAEENGVHYVDVTADMQRESRITDLFLDGDQHLSSEGYRVYSEALSRRITELGLLGRE